MSEWTQGTDTVTAENKYKVMYDTSNCVIMGACSGWSESP